MEFRLALGRSAWSGRWALRTARSTLWTPCPSTRATRARGPPADRGAVERTLPGTPFNDSAVQSIGNGNPARAQVEAPHAVSRNECPDGEGRLDPVQADLSGHRCDGRHRRPRGVRPASVCTDPNLRGT